MAAPTPVVARNNPGSDESSLFASIPTYAKAAGDEPLPGYRLISPLGRGGFGEVWKAEAPGGLLKAVKFVAPDPELGDADGGNALRQELAAFQRIKAIRHPFILQLERVELVAGHLVMVMELADSQLQERFATCVRDGLPGIPRDELLGYFADAAEALDVMGGQHGLQHLDIKPANLFLVGGHAKVGDYGLVARLEAGGPGAGQRTVNRGMTPRYVAPEVLNAVIDPRSDQYSLALVYQELLTGTFAYQGKTAAQIMLQHVTGVPDLSGLPPADRGPVGRALRKIPAERFPTCSDFVHALMSATAPPRGATPTTAEAPTTFFRRTRLGRTVTTPAPVPPAEAVTVPNRPSLTVPSNAPPAAPQGVRLDRIHAVIAAARLTGDSKDRGGYSPDQFVGVLVAAVAGWDVPVAAGGVTRLPDGAWGCRFPTGLLPAVVPLKLKTLLEEGWCDEVSQTGPGQVVLRTRSRPTARWAAGSRTPSGAMVTIRLPVRSRAGTAAATGRGSITEAPPAAPAGGGLVGEVEVVGELYGTPDPEFVRRAETGIPGLIEQVRRALQTMDERRKHRRLAYDGPVTAHPITPESVVLPAVSGRCRDVSAGGAAWVLPTPLPSRYAYLQFPDAGPAAGLAVLTRVQREHTAGAEHVYAGRFRTDMYESRSEPRDE